jgi:hypothetical protein
MAELPGAVLVGAGAILADAGVVLMICVILKVPVLAGQRWSSPEPKSLALVSPARLM